jgi:hypothetical protein
MLEDDVGVLAARQLADPGPEALPLGRVLRVRIAPELVPLPRFGAPVDDQLGAHPATDLRLAGASDHADRRRATAQRELRGVGAQAARGAPHQHDVALSHGRAVGGDELAVRGGVDQTGTGRLLPRQVCRLGHELVGLDQGELGEATEVGFVSPDALLRVEHRVVVPGRVLQFDAEAVGDHLVAGLPQMHARAGAQAVISAHASFVGEINGAYVKAARAALD